MKPVVPGNNFFWFTEGLPTLTKDIPNNAFAFEMTGTIVYQYSISGGWSIYILNADGEIVGPIITRHQTGALLDVDILEDGSLATVADDAGAIRVGDAATAGGVGLAPPLVVAVTAIANVITVADVSKLTKYPSRACRIVITAANNEAFNAAVKIIAGSQTASQVAALLAGRIVTIQMISTNGTISGDDVPQLITIGASGAVVTPVQVGSNPDFVLKLGGNTSNDVPGACVVFMGLGNQSGNAVIILGGYNFTAAE